ncbi:MAG: HAD-IC family P-type ATPase [Thermoanaerobaculaceae bacterium]
MEKIIANFHAAALRTAMLTGDNPRTGSAVAKQLEIDDVRAGLNPEGKVAAMRQLEERCGPVLMVGDRVHDAPALAAATCGVAMGAAGSERLSRRRTWRLWRMIGPRSKRRCSWGKRPGSRASKTLCFRQWCWLP